jgi:excisionase family DNA binding protein
MNERRPVEVHSLVHADPGKLSYRPSEAAAALGIGRTLLFRLLQSGEIGSFHVGAARLIPRAELEAWIARQMEAS